MCSLGGDREFCQVLFANSKQIVKSQSVNYLPLKCSITLCYDSGIVTTAFERFRMRVLDLLEDRGINQKALRGEFTEGWISNKLQGRRKLYFSDVEQIADALNVPMSELVRHPEDRTYDLSATEARLIEAFRKLSQNEQQALLTLATSRFRAVGRPSFPTSVKARRAASD
jgi:transcriptional regulator with XRE-family HTH domain